MWKPQAILLLLFVLASCEAKSPAPKKLKIVGVFGHLGKSHFDVFQLLLEELARRGHDLTAISHFPRTEKAIKAEPLPNYKDIDLRDDKQGVFVNVVDLRVIDHSILRIFKELYFLSDMSAVACELALTNPKVKELVASGQKFDVVLTESFNTDCFMVLVHKFNAPIIEISTHQLMPWAIDHMALSNEASYIPGMLTRQPRPMNFMGRVWNTVTIAFMTALYNTVFHSRAQAIAEREFGPDIPNLSEVSRNVTLMLVNTHYTLHGSIPFPPNVVEIGGMHISPKTNPLPKDIAKFLDEAHEGVLYFNLGSMVKAATMPPEKLDALLKMFASIPRKVIWKWEIDDLPKLSSNVLVKKWLPQSDILTHPNVKCYFGHGGLLGLSEGVHRGVPMVLMPFFGDQYQNAIAAQARGVAIVVKFDEMSEATLKNAVDEIFNNTRYMENARKLSKAFRDRPMTPLDTAVWWTEYIGRGNGLPYVRSERVNMSWVARNLVDVAAFLIAIVLLALYILYRYINHLFSRNQMKKYKKID
nr:PREDICTED: UDP-glucuronosyltransferase 2B15-like [Megachile rotundata]